MRKLPFLELLALALTLLPVPGRAVIVENLYRAEVEAEDHGSRQLWKAAREGLAQVLVKVSGSRAVLRDERVGAALAGNRNYLQQYQYRRRSGGELNLLIQYDAELVKGLLAEARQPLWTANRPPLLVWLVVDDASGRRFATSASHPDLLALLRRDLRRRGVPAIFPLHDLEDTVSMNVHDLWQLDEPAIYRASHRYGVADILAGRMSALAGGRWMGEWMLLQNGNRPTDGYYGIELETASLAGVNFAADRMGERYAVAAGAVRDENVFIRVDELPAYSDYRAAVDFLERIELVDAAWPAYVEGNSMIFSLRAQAEAEQLHGIIALGGRLVRLETPAPLRGSELPVALVYRWLGGS